MSGVKSQKGTHTPIEAERIEISAKMAESEAVQTEVTQAAIQAATAAVMARREADARPAPGANVVSSNEACRQRHGRPALK